MLDEILAEARQLMENAATALGRDLAGIRTGRASTNVLDNIRIPYYGNLTPLNQLATLSVPEPRLITIKPWEDNLIGEIEKAIRADAKLGLNPSNDGSIIRLPIPELTEERRREITRTARHRGEEAKVAMRQARREGLDLADEAQKDGEISEDEKRSCGEQIQKMTDEFVSRVDEIINKKEEEIMEV